MPVSVVNPSPMTASSLLHDLPDIALGELVEARTSTSGVLARRASEPKLLHTRLRKSPLLEPPRREPQLRETRHREPLVAELRSSGRRGSSARPAVGFGVLALLLATGACLGISTNLAKLAGDVGLAPLAFLAWSVSGAGILLFVLAAFRGELPPLTGRTVEYFILSAFVTIAATNLIFVAATPEVGAGFVAPAAALPPLLTYLGALALRMERFHAGRATGVVLALAGAGWIAFVELSLPDAATFWIVLTLLGPVMLAIGNLYRTLRWPPGLSAESLAPGMLCAAAVMLIAASHLPHPAFSLVVPLEQPVTVALVAIQTIVFAAQFVLLLQLQKRGGPVFLSLIGSVGAMIGVPAAILLLGESPPEGLAVGAVLIVGGVALLNTGRRQGASRKRGSRRRTSDKLSSRASTSRGMRGDSVPVARRAVSVSNTTSPRGMSAHPTADPAQPRDQNESSGHSANRDARERKLQAV